MGGWVLGNYTWRVRPWLSHFSCTVSQEFWPVKVLATLVVRVFRSSVKTPTQLHTVSSFLVWPILPSCAGKQTILVTILKKANSIKL